VVADHYAVLGVTRTASLAEITRAYHRLVRRHHPDAQHAEARPERLRAIVAAYTVLRDPSRRAAYDRHHRPPPPAPADRQPLIRVGPVRYHGRAPRQR
jgi:curved DNA-binding protein CbpA